MTDLMVLFFFYFGTVTHQFRYACVVEDDFLLSDPVNEKKFGVDLKRALERARSSSGKLFEGMTFYITAKVPVGAKLLKNVITAGGGKVCVFGLRHSEGLGLAVLIGGLRCRLDRVHRR